MEQMKDDRNPDEVNIDKVNNAIDGLVVNLEALKDALEKFNPEFVPGKAAKDTMLDLIDTALSPYLADLISASDNLA